VGIPDMRPPQVAEAAKAARRLSGEAVTPEACLRHDAADAAARRLRAQHDS
jgi:hypothetical protein